MTTSGFLVFLLTAQVGASDPQPAPAPDETGAVEDAAADDDGKPAPEGAELAPSLRPADRSPSPVPAEATATDDATEQAPAEPAGPRKLLVLALESTTINKDALAVLNGRIATSLSKDERFEVLTDDDIKRLVELEATKQVMGCDSSSCLAEIAGAIGADLVLYGRVASIEKTYHLQLSLFDANAARSIARRDTEGASLSELVDRVSVVVRSLVGELFGEDIPLPSPTAAKGSSPASAPPAEDDADAAAVSLSKRTPAAPREGADEGGWLGTALLTSGVGVGALGAAGLVGGSIMAGAGFFVFGQTSAGAVARQIAQYGLWAGSAGAAAGGVVLLAGAAVASSSLAVE